MIKLFLLFLYFYIYSAWILVGMPKVSFNNNYLRSFTYHYTISSQFTLFFSITVLNATILKLDICQRNNTEARLGPLTVELTPWQGWDRMNTCATFTPFSNKLTLIMALSANMVLEMVLLSPAIRCWEIQCGVKCSEQSSTPIFLPF